MHLFVNCFQINTFDDPGKIYKVRLGFGDDNDDDQKWLLNKVGRWILTFLDF